MLLRRLAIIGVLATSGCALEPSGSQSATEEGATESQQNGDKTVDIKALNFQLFQDSGLRSWLKTNCQPCHVQQVSPNLASDATAAAFDGAMQKINLDAPADSSLVKRMAQRHNCPYECSQAGDDLKAMITKWSTSLKEQTSGAASAEYAHQTQGLPLSSMESTIRTLDQSAGFLHFPADAVASPVPSPYAIGEDPLPTTGPVAMPNASPTPSPVFKKRRYLTSTQGGIAPNRPAAQLTPAEIAAAGLATYKVVVPEAGNYELVIGGSVQEDVFNDFYFGWDLADPKNSTEYLAVNLRTVGRQVFETVTDSATYLEKGEHTLYLLQGYRGARLYELFVTSVVLPKAKITVPYSDLYLPNRFVYELPVGDFRGKVALAVFVDSLPNDPKSVLMKRVTLAVSREPGETRKVRIANIMPHDNGTIKTKFSSYAKVNKVLEKSSELEAIQSLMSFDSTDFKLGFAIKTLELVDAP